MYVETIAEVRMSRHVCLSNGGAGDGGGAGAADKSRDPVPITETVLRIKPRFHLYAAPSHHLTVKTIAEEQILRTYIFV